MKPRRWGIRGRLTLLTAALVAALLVILAVVQLVVFRSFLVDRTAASLRAAARPSIDHTLAGPAGRTGDLARFAPNLARDLTSKGVAAQVLDLTGRIVATSTDQSGGGNAPPLPPADGGQDRRALGGDNEVSYTTSVQVSGHRSDLLVVLIPLRGRGGHILGLAQLSTSSGIIDNTLSDLALFDVVGIAAVLAAVGLILPLVAGAALRPLRHMIATTRTISGGDLSQRLNLPRGNDEVGQLAAAFDTMVDRLEALFASQKQLVADASHELRTPLTAVRGSLDMVLMGVEQDPEAIQRILRSVRRELDRMARLVTDLLTLSRLDRRPALQRERVDVTSLLEEVVSAARGIAGQRTLSVRNDAVRLEVSGDPDRLRQVFWNLLENAVKYSPEDGQVWLEATRQESEVRITVANDGPGIANVDLPRVFDRFFRGERSRARERGGSGLGLAIVRETVLAHGGRVEAGHRAGGGAEFRVWLPRESQ
ncbi:MAG: sensor histidine kinase [Chloroflexota bacterium]